MSQQNETGHAKNVANLQKLIERVTTQTNYNPSVDNLKLPALLSLYDNALVNLQNVNSSKNANKSAIHIRQEFFVMLKPLTTRIINQLDILNLTEGTFNQAKALNRLIQGKRKSSITVEESDQENTENEEDTIADKETKSVSRQSYTQTAETLSQLIQLLETTRCAFK